MNANVDTAGSAVPRWFVWSFLLLLVLPFDPYWMDFEQVRRGMLLVLAGVALIVLRKLPRVRGEAFVWAFGGALVASACVAWAGDAWFRTAGTLATFQPWDAIYRLAHWVALLVVLRLGAAAGTAGAVPIATVLAITSLFGIVQWLGFGKIPGYDAGREPVSVFGNLNVASEWTAVAAIAVAAAWPAFAAAWQRALAAVALVLAGCHLVVDQSRSGLYALPAALLVLAWLRRRDRVVLCAALAGAGALLLFALVPLRQGDAAAQSAAADRSAKTVKVRLEIAKGTFRLFAGSPVCGLGPGQFAVHFPRVRSQEEIDASSSERQFRSEVRTAHDDWLELLADGGVVTMLAFAAMLFVLQRQQRDRTMQLPLLVLLLLMLVRAPLGNAPAVVVALWWLGVSATDAAPPSRRARWLAALAGAALVALGVPVLVANQAGARFQAAIAHQQQPPLLEVITAAAWMPFEPRWQSLLCRERLAARDYSGAAVAGARAIALRPFEANHYLDAALVCFDAAMDPGANERRTLQLTAAGSFARQGLAFDPANPELRVRTSAVLALQGDADGAIEAVVKDPHPVLRAQLATHFASLAQTCRSNPEVAARFQIEHHAIAAIDGLGNKNEDVLRATSEHVMQLLETMRAARRRPDARSVVLSALHHLDLGKPNDAIDLGKEVMRFPKLEPWQSALFGAQIDRLRAFESWQPFFAGR